MAEAQTPANVQPKAGHEPDPTVLTTQALWREIAHLNELANAKIAAIEKATVLAHENYARLQDEKFKAIDLALKGEHNLKEEKFNKVEQRFQLIETTRIEQKQEAASALNTALQAAKEVIYEQSKNTIAAAAKSELSITKQIDQQGTLIQTVQSTLDDKINDVKERLTKMEGVGAGRKDFWGYIVGAIGVIATLITIFVFLSKT